MGEGVEAFEAALFADLADVKFAALEELGGFGEAAFAHVFAEADAEAVAEDGAEVADAVAQFFGDVADGHGAAEVGADVFIDALEDDVADVVAGVDVAALGGELGAVAEVEEEPAEEIGDFQRVARAGLGLLTPSGFRSWVSVRWMKMIFSGARDCWMVRPEKRLAGSGIWRTRRRRWCVVLLSDFFTNPEWAMRPAPGMRSSATALEARANAIRICGRWPRGRRDPASTTFPEGERAECEIWSGLFPG